MSSPDSVKRRNSGRPKTASRKGSTPSVILNDFFHRAADRHFFVEGSGRVVRSLDLEWAALAAMAAWKPLRPSLSSDVQAVQDRLPLNPALYSVIVSYEAVPEGITEQQYREAVKLHAQIRHEIAERCGIWFPLNRYHVLSWDQVFSGGRTCPDGFSWEVFYNDLGREDDETDVAGVIAALESLKRRGLLS